MPVPPHAPSVYFDNDEINLFVETLSDRLRSSKQLRPRFDKLVGNQWYEFEREIERFIRVNLFLTNSPTLDLQLLYRITTIFNSDDIELLEDLFLDVCLTIFPLLSAAAMNELAERLSTLILPVIKTKDQRFKQRALLNLHQKITSGSLLSDL